MGKIEYNEVVNMLETIKIKVNEYRNATSDPNSGYREMNTLTSYVYDNLKKVNNKIWQERANKYITEKFIYSYICPYEDNKLLINVHNNFRTELLNIIKESGFLMIINDTPIPTIVGLDRTLLLLKEKQYLYQNWYSSEL